MRPFRQQVTLSQALLLLAIGSVGTTVIAATVNASVGVTVMLLLCVGAAGLHLCTRTASDLGDTSLNALGTFWLVKLALTLFLLYVGWIPELDPNTSTTWGYDPQRYYTQAQELPRNDWSPDFLAINYAGILYFYAGVFYALGSNPVVAALLNAFLTLLASLYLVRFGYRVVPARTPHHWALALILLIPELVWFDVMTSREGLLAVLLLFATMTPGRYFARASSLTAGGVTVISAVCLLGIAAIRTSLVFPVLMTISVMALVVGSTGRGRSLRITYVALLVATAVLITGGIAGALGGSDFDLVRLVQSALTSSDNVALSDEVDWSQNSVGALLIPGDAFEALAFLIPRMVLYLIAPLPGVPFSWTDLAAGKWMAWQGLALFMSSLVNIVVVPYAIASLVHSIRHRALRPAPLALHITYWTLFAAIAGGNLIIHERYRVMVSALLWTCGWLGATQCTSRLIMRSSVAWYGALALCVPLYLVYKLL
jgi:hypothetical protein